MITCSEFSFIKYQGNGNDFILIDGSVYGQSLSRERIVQLCSRQYGVGADGLACVKGFKSSVLEMEFFNADGKRALMCGNALRCVAFHGFKSLEVLSSKITISLGGVSYDCFQEKEKIKVVLPLPKLKGEGVYTLGKREVPYIWVDTGVDHLVLHVEPHEVGMEEFKAFGKKVRHDKAFAPGGVNVNLAAFTSPNTIYMRTYEKGVEDETLACGSGAAAAVFAMQRAYKNSNKNYFVEFFSKEKLEFNLEKDSRNQVLAWFMLGEAQAVFHGTISL
ncbi:diaminopimelate epimerase [Candidatus Aerophobetes bacterium]|uniref:Diaminopimelate epimerase n=1 Tax=Aerophobetes bacterium TaxID=2030807 RepID=A0A2A4X796_UNCAE|nr:MAG: diaminopimelate epimerase [Candidatus Aerophobetes bacterium]